MSLAVARLTLCWCNGTSVVGTSGNDEIVERNSGSAAGGGADGGGADGGLVVAETDDNIVLINLCGNTMNKGVWSTQLRHWTCDGAVQIRITEKSQHTWNVLVVFALVNEYDTKVGLVLEMAQSCESSE